VRPKRLLLAAPVFVMTLATLLAYTGKIPYGLFRAPWDKVAHGALYGWLAACAFQALPSRHRRWAWAGPLLLGVVDECTQTLSRQRSADPWDFAADACGIAVAYWWMRRKKEKDLVDGMGFEPTTPTLRTWCSPN
jgi:VanZ family protein